MKHLMLVCLLAMSAAAGAQTTTAAPTPADEAKREAEEAKIRAKLDEARARLDKAARDVAEYSTQLGREAMGGEQGIRTIRIDGDRHAVLGVQIDNASDKAGARVMHVSPGGAAEAAGIRDGDVIVSIDGKSIAGSSSAGEAVVEQMRSVKPDQKVKVRVLRDGKNKDFVVVARPMTFDRRVFTMRGGPGMMAPGGEMGAIGPMGHMGAMPMVQQFHAFFPGEFGGMELASLTPKLGAYFGTKEGVLVVQAPDNEIFKLEDGDVIQSIDGRKPDNGAHAMRILRSYRSGEKVNLNVLRQRKPLTLAITMPDRPEFDEDHFFNAPVPAIPPEPPVPAVPGGAGTLE
jgi:membrane-associated protease RseP (regulator of RpoE activity)